MTIRRSLTVWTVVLAIAGATVCALGGTARSDSTEPLVPADIRTSLQDRNYADAVRLIDADIQQGDEGADCLLYLKGVALYYQKDYQGASETLSALERDYPDSPWLRKARFARAEAHAARRDYAKAEAVYEAEASRLLATSRKDELAGVLVAQADRLATPRDVSDPDSAKPDYPRARRFYNAALDFEISRALRDEVMFKRAKALLAAGNPSGAANDLEEYLKAFDPGWPEAAPGVRAPGAHVFEARFELARCYQASGRRRDARRIRQDLVAALDKRLKAPAEADDLSQLKVFREDAAYQIAETYRVGAPAETLRAVKALRDYLAEYPAGKHAVQAAFDVARDYEKIGRHEDAVQAYCDFLAGKGFSAQTEDAAHKLAELTGEAKFLLGRVYLARKQYDEAKAVWREYIAGYPSGPRWSQCQQGIIEATYSVGADLRAKEDYAAAREAWEAFLEKYPLDSRARQIMYDFGDMAYRAAEAAQKKEQGAPADGAKLYAGAISAWEKLVSKYPGAEESSRAQYMIGQTCEEKLRDLDRAIEEYRKCTWGSFAPKAARRIARMTDKQLTVLTERTWRTDESPRIKVRMRNIEELAVAAYRLDLEDYFRKTQGISGVEGLDTLLIDADRSWTVKAEGYAKYRPIEQDIEIPMEEGAPGVFAVRVTGGQLQATTLVIRSDLEIVVKSSKKALLVFAENMRLQKPWAGATVIASDGEKVFFEGATGEDGVLYKTFDELKSASRASVLALSGGHAASNLVQIGKLGFSEGLSPKGYVYTDRPAYRPGQKVAIRAVLREVSGGSYSFEPGRQYVLEVVDSQGRVLDTERLALSEFGTIHHEFELDPSAPTGAYTVRCRRPNGPTFSGKFEVRRYKLENMELTFELARRIVFRGEPLEGKLVARYYYGEPVVRRQVEYYLPDGARRTAATDENGEISFSFDTAPLLEEQQVTLKATIVGENVSADQTAFVAVRAYRASVSALRGVYLAREPFDVTVRTVDVEDKPVGRELTLKALKRESAPDGTWAEALVSESAAVTDAGSGECAVSVALDEGGRYVLRVEGADRFGNPITAETAVFISDDEDATRLRILADTERFKVGENPTVVLHSRLEPTLALLTYEGEEIISYRLVKLARGKNRIQIPVSDEHFPNFALSACAMAGSKFYTATHEFKVERELKVAVKPDKESYKPGARAKVRIVTTDQNGQPVSAELSLAMVDEALLSVYPDRLPPIRDFFEGGARRQAALATTSSCTFSYHPATQPVPEALISEKERLERAALQASRREAVLQKAGELTKPPAQSYAYPKKRLSVGAKMLEEGLEVADMARLSRARSESKRQRGDLARAAPASKAAGAVRPARPTREAFPETAYWNPAVVTDARGRATVILTMPDSMTKWRLTARGATPATLVGQRGASVVTQQDFFVELKLPAVVTEGDTVRIAARLHNLTDYKGDAELRLQLEAGDQKVTIPAKIKLEGRGVVEHVFDGWKVPAARRLTVALEGSAGQASDALSRKIPIRPWGIEFADSRSGLVTDRATFELELPSGRKYADLAMKIRVDAGLEQRLIDAALARGPVVWRCQAGPMQTQADSASDLLGVASVMAYAQGLGREQAPDWKLLGDRAEGLVAALVVTQRPGGGWNWAGSSKDAPDPHTSSRAVWALAEARRMGLAVPSETMDKAVGYLKVAYTGVKQDNNELKAAILHSLATVGEADFGHANRLYRLRQSLSPAALAHTAICLALLDRKPMGGDVLDVLASRREQGGRWPGAGNRPWMRSDDETTALAALAYLHVRPGDQAAKEAVEYLLGHQPWVPARARGPALAALSKWFAEEKPAANDYRLSMRVNEEDVRTLTVRGASPGLTVVVPAKLVKDGKNRVDLIVEGRGRPHYVAVLTGFSSDFGTVSSRQTHLYPSRRRYKAAPPMYKGKPVPIGFGILSGSDSSWRNTVSQLPVGEAVNVDLSLDRRWASGMLQTPAEYGYTVVREPLPAGATVLDGSIHGSFERYEVGDGEITFLIGPRYYSASIRYTLVGYAPGAYRVLPTVARSVYSEGVMAVGQPRAFKVLGRGEKSSDPYRPTPYELYYLGKAYFDDGVYAEAMPRLEKLFDQWQQNLKDNYYRETARMLLFMSIDRGDARKIVTYFEAIKERYPDLVIPFDKVLAVGRAYREMEEFERAMLVFKATISASFVKDAHVAGVLEEQGQALASVDYMKRLWLTYPDVGAVRDSYLALSDTLYDLASRTGELAELKEKGITHDDLMLEAIRVLVQYLTLYPEDPTADDAGLNMVNAYLELGDFKSTVALCRALRKRFPDSSFLDNFEYVEALALWNLGEYDAAVALASKVAETVYTLPDGTRKPSDNKDLALYIIGQIWHARRQPEKAIAYYSKVNDKFADAAEAIDYFQRRSIELEEVSTFEPGEDVSITLKYRNIPVAHLLVYRVDLMTLYLTEKNLSRITKVRLAGIRPAMEPLSVELGDGKDYVEKEKKIPLQTQGSGAYLVICRGGDLDASGMALVTPLKLEIQEDKVSGRVRVNVMDRKSGKYLKGVHVKVIGSNNRDFVAGETDLRGVLVADGIRGAVTVIARDEEGQFAFYRGKQSLGPPETRPQAERVPQASQGEVQYLENARGLNIDLQQRRAQGQKALYKTMQKGVQVQQMMQ